MHPYIPHLLADIANAHRTEIQNEKSEEESLENHFREIDRWTNRDTPEHTFGYYCGLKKEDFPPAEQLSDEEMILVRNAFEKMMFTWNHGIDLPETLPPAFAYQLVIDSLEMETSIINMGMMHFDFCTGYAPDCAFKEYCPCLKIWEK